MSFNQLAPTVPTVLNTSNCFVFGNTASGNALSVQQLGAGNVATFRTTTGATALFINPSGNVGIGTTNPSSTLHVKGNANFDGTSSGYYTSIIPKSSGRINNVNITALNARTRTSNASATAAVSKWTTRTSAADSGWNSVCWSPELSLFVAVAAFAFGANDRVMTSPNGINWTLRTSPSGYTWNSVCWAPELSLFVAVTNSGSSTQVMTSTNGIDNWTLRTSAGSAPWRSVCWAPELSLFVAVSDGSNQVMTSPTGIDNWALRTTEALSGWSSVCWSPELSLFVAVAASGAYPVMTSPNGINWTLSTSAPSNPWRSVCWSPELSLFVAVAIPFDAQVMTSPDGIVWTSRVAAASKDWYSVCWAPELSIFVAAAQNGNGNDIMTSPNGINWTLCASPAGFAGWRSVCWAPELSIFAAVANSGFENRVMTSAIGMPNSNNVVKALTSQMVVLPSGNVGIGTTNPSESLHVYGGNIRLGIGGTASIFNSVTGSDYGSLSLVSGYQGASSAPRINIVGWTGAGTVNGDNIIQLATNGSTRMTINQSGNVGIGTANPGYPLVVNYTNILGGVNETGIYINNTVKTNSSQLSLAAGNVYSIISNGSLSANTFQIYNSSRTLAPFTITSAGNVGIGATDPYWTLSTRYAGGNDSSTATKLNFGAEINNSTASGPNNRPNLLLFTDNNSTQGAMGAYRRTFDTDFTGGLVFYVASQPAGYTPNRPTTTAQASGSLTEAMRIDPNGRVGIGIVSPSYPLHVVGSTSATSTFKYINYASTPNWTSITGQFTITLGIYAALPIGTGDSFVLFSDERIKKEEQPTKTYLEVVDSVAVKTFSYIDQVQYGPQKRVGFFAQEVEKVLPDAVTKTKDFIPNIFQKCSAEGNCVTVVNHGLAEGTKVRVFSGQNKIESNVHVIDENTIELENTLENEVFVVGTEVDDFRVLNYDYMSSVAFGGLKELSAIVKTQAQTIETLEARLAALEAKLNSQ